MNKYYILTITKPELEQIVLYMTDNERSMFVEKVDTVRFNNDGTKCVVKMLSNLIIPPPQIEHLTPFTHSEILVELSTSEWIFNI